MRITLVRHGESEGNTRVHDYSIAGDHQVQLTEKGHRQAHEAGLLIRDRMSVQYGQLPLIYTSPYHRTRQTLEGLVEGATPTYRPRVFEDPRLRETDHGYSDVEEQEAMRKIHGFFYYRFAGGESPADCFDRVSTFLESMMRQVERKKPNDIIIVAHGLTIRCFVMRFLHLSVEQFESMANPHNCDIITIAHKNQIAKPMFVSGRWGVEGVRLRPEKALVEA